ncbi:ABC transporter permease [Spirosoma arcticum]
MFSHIIRYDWLLLRANRTLAASIGLLSLFVAFAIWTGHSRVQFQQQTIADIGRVETESIAKNRALVAELERTGKPFAGNSHRDPTAPYTVASSRGNRYVFKQPEPLAVVSVGQSDLQPYYYKFAFAKKQALYHGEEIENASILYNGSFDLSFALIYLLPLLIIALTYNLVSSEREQGTLFMLMSSTASLRQIIVSKYVFRFLLLTGAFLTLTTAGLLLTGVSLIDNAPAIGFMFLLTMGYSAFWFGLSFWVNSVGRDTGFNAAVLVGVWLVLGLVLPTVLNVVVSATHPMPSRIDLIAETREASDNVKKEGDKKMAQYYGDHPELLPKGKPVNYKDFAIGSVRATLAVEAAIRPLETQFETQYRNQQRLIGTYRFLSPMVFMQQSLNDVAGTGDEQFRAFQTDATRQHEAYRDFFAGKIFRQESFKAADYDKIPSFRYVAPRFPLFAPTNIANLICLLALTSLFVGFGLSRIPKIRLATA